MGEHCYNYVQESTPRELLYYGKFHGVISFLRFFRRTSCALAKECPTLIFYFVFLETTQNVPGPGRSNRNLWTLHYPEPPAGREGNPTTPALMPRVRCRNAFISTALIAQHTTGQGKTHAPSYEQTKNE